MKIERLDDALIAGPAGKDRTELFDTWKGGQVWNGIHRASSFKATTSLNPSRALMLARAAPNSSLERRLSEIARETATAPAMAERTEAASASPSVLPAALIQPASLPRSNFTPTSKAVRNFLDCRGSSELRATIGQPAEGLSR